MIERKVNPELLPLTHQQVATGRDALRSSFAAHYAQYGSYNKVRDSRVGCGRCRAATYA